MTTGFVSATSHLGLPQGLSQLVSCKHHEASTPKQHQGGKVGVLSEPSKEKGHLPGSKDAHLHESKSLWISISFISMAVHQIRDVGGGAQPTATLTGLHGPT
jgi:hypothetical protein